MSDSVDHLVFAATHEWAKQLENNTVEVGISDYAQDALGDVVYVELPEVGDEVTQGEQCCAVESVKAASDIYAPVSGTVTEVNSSLDDEPELINESPYENGWMFRIEVSDADELASVLSAEAYQQQIES